MTYQFNFLSQLKNGLKQGEVYILVDFYHNYILKYNSKMQSAHFGASKKQASLQSGAVYYKNNLNELKCLTFASISDCLRRDAATAWAMLEPVFELLKRMEIKLKGIHFQSDGPTNQYKNKTNFFLFCYVLT